MKLERMIELTCNKNIDISFLSYQEMIYYTMHNFYLQMNYLYIKTKLDATKNNKTST